MICRKCTLTKGDSEFYARERVCKKCRIEKAKQYYHENYEKKREYIRQWAIKNPEKVRANQAKRRAANPEKFKDYGARHRLRVRFGITLEQWKQMFEEQGGLCYICRMPETVVNRLGEPKRLSLDHNHKTGAIRHLLCDHCNRGLGSFRDNPELLREAANYIEQVKDVQTLQTV